MAKPDAMAVAEAVFAAMVAGDRVFHALGMRKVAVAPGHAVLEMTVREDMLNSHELCHGGLIFTLADTAFAIAANATNQTTLLAGAGFDLVAPARLGETLRAEARERWQGKRSGIYDVTVTGDGGRLVALFRGRAQRVAGKPAPDLPGPQDGEVRAYTKGH